MATKNAFKVIGTLAVAALALAACGTTSGGTPESTVKDAIGAGEGQVSILGWPGYVEDGSNDPKVDWVSKFTADTGCKVNFKPFGTSDEAVTLMRTGQYDVISASGDASLRLVAGGDVQPVNMSLLKNYADVYPFLKDKAWNTVDGKNYGMPHGWGANLLMYRSDKVTPAPTSWSAVFTDAGANSGKVTAYDSPIYIADAAVYLMAHQPELNIKNPYALDADPARRSRHPAQGPARAHWRVLERCGQGSPVILLRHHRGRHHLAGGSQHCPGRRREGGDAASLRGRHGLVGHLDDRRQDQEPQLLLHVA